MDLALMLETNVGAEALCIRGASEVVRPEPRNSG